MKNNKFIVVVPVYNADKYIEKCMNSILDQDYDNFDIIVIDDCSTDNTAKILRKIHEEYEFNLENNEERVGSALSNIIKGIESHSKDKEDIIVTVDGDDWLYDDKVLSYLNEEYQDDEIYMTYGQFIPLSNTYGKYCRLITDTRNYRKSGQWYASHLRTFKKKLWDLIDENDLKDSSGGYYKTAWDASFMYPMIELCGSKHMKFIDKILYIYNDLNPINDMKTDEAKQLATALEIRNKPSYDEITYKI